MKIHSLLSGSILARFFLAISAINFSNAAFAADYTWNSDGGASYTGLWTDTTTDGWNGGPPVSGDTALINNGTVTTNANNQTAGINLNIGGGTLDSGSSYLVVDANTTLQAGTIIIGRAAGSYFAGWLGGYLGGTLTVSGSAASSITGGSYTGQDINMGTLTTFDVNDVTAGTDLTVGVKLTDFYNGSWLPSSLVKSGAGTMTLTGANSYTGDTTVEAGTLSLGDGTNHTNLSDTATVSIDTGATLNLNFSGSDTVGKLIINGDTVSGGIYNSSHGIYGSYFTGSGSLEVLNYSGTWISTVDGNWGTSSNWQSDVIANGADKTATFNASPGVTVNLDSARTIGGLVFGSTGYTLAGASTLTLDTSSDISTITVGSGLAATISAKLAGADVLTKAGAGTLTLSAQNDFSNAIDVSQGTLELATDWTFGNVGTGTPIVPGLVTVENGATLRAVNALANQLNGLILNGGTVEAVGVGNTDWGNFHLTGNVTATGTSSLNAEVALRAANVDFFVDSGGTLNVGGVMHNGAYFGIYSGTPSNVSKSGDGTMVLSAANTYTGSTTVDAGALEITNTGGLRFIPTTNGVTNAVATSGTGTLSFLGTVDLDLSAAVASGGNTWNLFNLTSFTGLTPAAVSSTLGSFSEVTPGTWEFPVTGAKWVFTESNGNLAYTVTATPYETWGSTYGLTAGTEGGDLDNDGLTNFEEYSFGLIPNSGSSVNAFAVPFNKATGTFSYTRRTQSLTGLTYTVWYSTDLSVWTEDAGAVQDPPSVTGEVETVPVTLTGTLLANPKLFIQVRAE
jgi:autotransporter-associated beta strand protein